LIDVRTFFDENPEN